MPSSHRRAGNGSLISPRSFTKRVRRLIQKQDPSATVSMPDDLQLVVSLEGREAYKAFLGNAYTDYQNSPHALEEIVSRYAQATRSALTIDPTTINVDRLVPIVKDWGFIEDTRKAVGVSGTPDDEIAQVFERYNDSLVVLYAEDMPGTIQYPAWETVAKAGLELADLRTLAVNNLQKMLPPIQAIGLERSFYGVMAGGFYETSLLLVDSIWQERRFDVEGDYVVALPARGMLFVTGNGKPSLVRSVRRVAAEAMRESSYPITDKLFIYDGSKFVEYDKQ